MGILKNIVTLGATARVDKKIAELEALIGEYQRLSQLMEEKKRTVSSALDEVIVLKLAGINGLKRVEKLLNQLSPAELTALSSAKNPVSLKENLLLIQRSVTAAKTAEDSTKAELKIRREHNKRGENSGQATSLHSMERVNSSLAKWALYDQIPPILTVYAHAAATAEDEERGREAKQLKGVESYLELLRGGFSVPQAVVVNGLLSHYRAHQKIQEISLQIAEIEEVTGLIREGIYQLDTLDKCAVELRNLLTGNLQSFEREFRQIYRRIYPIKLLSGVFKRWKRGLGQPQFSGTDLSNIADMADLATDLLKVLEKRIHKEK